MDPDKALAYVRFYVRLAAVVDQARDLLRALDTGESRNSLRMRAAALISALEIESIGPNVLDDGDIGRPVLASDPGEYRRWQGLLWQSGLATDQAPEPADDALPDRTGVELPVDIAVRNWLG